MDCDLNNNTRLSNWKLAAYAAPAFPIAVFSVPFAIYAPPFFAAEMGLGLAAVGTIFMIARLWDLISDPLMGIVSDRIPSRWGRRRHWIVLSVPLLMIATVLVMFPNHIPGTYGSTLYLLLSLFFLYIGYTLLTISHISWGAELSEDYHERSRIQAWREFASLTAMAVVLLVPAILEQTGSAVTMQDKMNAMGWCVLFILPPMVFIAVRNVGEKKFVKPAKVAGLKEEIRAFWENRFLRRIVIADLMIHLPGAIRGSLFVFYVNVVIGMPEWTAVIMISYFMAGPLAVPIWVAISRRWSKHKACAVGVLLHVVVTLSYMIPGQGDALLFALLFFCSGLVYAGVPFLLRSMIADVVEYDRYQTGQDRTGLFFSTVTTTSKVGAALGIGIAYPLLAFVGFDPSGTNDPAQVDNLRYVFAFLPAVSEVFVVALIYFYKLDENMLQKLRKEHQVLESE